MLQCAEDYLQESCPHMRQAISQLGPCRLRQEKDRFLMLARSITSQQISSAAARAIIKRLQEQSTNGKVTAEAVRDLGEDALRAVGYSRQKASYLLDLSAGVLDHSLNLNNIGRLDDEEVIAQLTRIRGIGVWTAQMFLIFALGRMDVLPWDDLGVRQAIRKFHGLSEMPGKKQMSELAAPWRPYASIASWYCWRSIDTPAKKNSK